MATHKSDCALNNAPAMETSRCDCGVDPTTREQVAAMVTEALVGLPKLIDRVLSRLEDLPPGTYADEMAGADMKPESALHLGIVRPDEKLNQYHMWNRIGTSWQATLFTEIVKSQAMMAIPTDDVNDKGNQMARIMTISEVMDRSRHLVDGIIQEVTQRGWTIELPSLDQLRDKSTEQVGFTTRRDA